MGFEHELKEKLKRAETWDVKVISLCCVCDQGEARAGEKEHDIFKKRTKLRHEYWRFVAPN